MPSGGPTHLIHGVPVFQGTHPYILLKHPCKVLWIFEPQLISNLTHRLVSMNKIRMENQR
jgi:hypothetical protein